MKECYEVFEIIDIDDFSPWFGVPIAFSKDGFYKRPTLCRVLWNVAFLLARHECQKFHFNSD